MLLSRTKFQPAHYMLEIEFFSVLSEDPTIKIESDVFEASGYKWRLDLYPNRRDEENGASHISLYLTALDTTSLSKVSEEVHFDVKFFLFDHIRSNYVTFQEVDGKRATFGKEMKWGFDKLISVENFRESTNGYLLEDTCVFGVEVVAFPKNTLKDRCLSMIKPPATMNTYSWTVDNFSAVTDMYLTSDVFKIGKVKWNLLLYPKGDIAFPGNLHCALQLHKPESLPKCWKVYAKFELRVKNQLVDSQSAFDDRITETQQHWFASNRSCLSFGAIMKLSELHDTTKGFLLNDSLTVEAKISVIGMLKNNF